MRQCRWWRHCAGWPFPPLIFLLVNSGPGGSPEGWAIPAATDIAFALAVLAVVGSNLPTALRAFLLTLAVVDDLVVVLIIAVFYTESLHLAALGLAAIACLAWLVLQHLRVRSPLVYVPLAVARLVARPRERCARDDRRDGARAAHQGPAGP